ncbi:MlaC/ttg2D family ABC transporter substrate-binding protein [Legionella oakridgensis]|uniref:ABC-type transport system involved in resistance to organic solvents, auxiliary component n=2 Tax=Legionella oakridgensis TaxID=29423 RepID=W0BG97_9GAMM|nr:ABC transporter substrate-binding protein [Legionella oakridgensis]AHE67459.1 ABC-type transport system involved in resistance to organic solvents, auxiliary component [Legionella oakridgensis ATCC 33761 = DSM 21215]ETO92988.1 ABC-type transport system involved in resistance to organic solvents, auxiliary component [Legionella oakridgensis RV-2-2007]KTD43516.1 toluene tolerance protein Ttg2D [Legionella oakridgensis]STY20508.1 signal peptide protein, toluene tolerance protein Ttg2D [Legionel
MKQIKAIMLMLTVFLTSGIWAQSSPIPMLENAANKIIATLNENKSSLKNNPQVIHQAVERYLLPIVDVQGMSRSVLGRQAWNKASAAERKQFTQEFTQLVIRTYASPLAEYTDEKVKFLPLRNSVDGRFIRVNSIIVRSNGQNIPLSYSLIAKQGQWKIYDLSVEGVSLLQSFRSQFGQVLQNSNMQNLITQMRQHKAA